MEITNILSLSDGNKYIIVSKTEYNDKTYLCLVDINNNENVKFAYLRDNKVVIVKREDINETLSLKLFNEIGKVIMNLE